MKRNVVKRCVSLCMVMMVVFSMLAVAPSEVDAAAKYQLPSSISHYYNDAENGQAPVWKHDTTEKIRYNKKGDVIQFRNVKTKWTYKKGKATKSKTGSKKVGFIANSKYKKGKIKSTTVKHYSKKGKVLATASAKYKYKKGWIKKISGKAGGSSYSETYSWSLYGNGMPKSLTLTTKVGKTKYKNRLYFNQYGLITTIKEEVADMRMEYKKDASGRVVEKITYWGSDPLYRTVYSYSGASTSNKKTYIGIVNNDATVSNWVRDAIPHEYGIIAK